MKIKKIVAKVAIIASLSMLSVFYVASIAYSQADFNKEINYQGKLTNASSVPVADGAYFLKFRLYTSPTGATTTNIWEEIRTASGDKAQVTNGIFSVMLGSSTAFTNVNFNQPLYLGVEIGGSGGAPVWDDEMVPRKRLGAVPAAFEAQKFGGLATTSFLRSDAVNSTSTSSTWLTFTQNGSGNIAVFTGSGNVGIGTSTPYAKLSVVGETVSSYFTATSTTATSTFTGGFVAGGTTGLNVLQNGNVGVGTVGPTDKLEVNGTIDATTGYKIGDWNLANYSGTALSIGNASWTSLGLFTSNTERARIDASGNMGIGTSTPYARLTVNSATNPQFVLSDTTAGINLKHWYASTTVGDLVLGTLSDNLATLTERFRVTNAGNVGIGTSTPYSKLSVVGDTLSTSFTGTSTTATSTWVLGSFGHLETGAASFEDNAGAVSWMDMAITSQSATGTKHRYSAQLDSTSMFTISGEVINQNTGTIGSTTVHIGTSTPLYSTNLPGVSAIINYGILCVDNGGDDCDNSTRTAGTLYSVGAAVGSVDVAENFPTRDDLLETGNLVMLDPDNPIYIKKYAASSRKPVLLGVVSRVPGITLGGFGDDEFTNERKVPVALAGRVPVKVSTEGGEIDLGDFLAPSSISGVAMKATTSGTTIGIALGNFSDNSSSTEQIIGEKKVRVGETLVFVNLGYSRLDPHIVGDQIISDNGIWEVNTTGKIRNALPFGATDFDIVGVREILSATGTWSIDKDGKLTVKEVHTNKLCVGTICVDENQLRNILDREIPVSVTASLPPAPAAQDADQGIEFLDPAGMPADPPLVSSGSLLEDLENPPPP